MMDKKPSSMLVYIAARKPLQLKSLIEKYNNGKSLPMPGTPYRLAQFADKAVELYGESFNKDLAGIHPDKDFLLANSPSSSLQTGGGLPDVLERLIGSKYNNASGCGCSHMSNADGSVTTIPCAKHAYSYATGVQQQPNGQPQRDNVTIAAVAIIGVSALFLTYGLVTQLKK